jgi:hypothetical protein
MMTDVSLQFQVRQRIAAANVGNTPGQAAPTPATPAPGGPSSRDGIQLTRIKDGYVPQGQGYDKAHGQIVTSYYKDIEQGGKVTGHKAYLTLHNVKGGAEARHVELLGPKHAGGTSVSKDGNHIYVSDTNKMYVYNRKDILKGSPVKAAQVVPLTKGVVSSGTGKLDAAGSFMTVKGGWAYVGSYTNKPGHHGAIYRYPVNENTGIIDEKGRQGPIAGPPRAQGMTVVKGGFLFTTGEKNLVFQRVNEKSFKPTGTPQVIGKLDPYSQGLNVVGNELWVTYESGAEKYRDHVKRPHGAIQRIPLTSLALDGTGLTVDSLQQ